MTNTFAGPSDLKRLVDQCKGLEIVHAEGCQISMDSFDYAWETPTPGCLELQHIGIDTPSSLLDFYARQLRLHYETLRPFVNPLGYEDIYKRLEDRMLNVFSKLGSYNTATGFFDKIKGVYHVQSGLLGQVVLVCDEFRRLRYRVKSFTRKDLEFIEKFGVEKLSIEQLEGRVETLIEMCTNITAIQSFKGDNTDWSGSANDKPAGFPFPSLRPFGISPTRRLTLRVDSQNLEYEYLPPLTGIGGFSGKITKMQKITIKTSDEASRIMRKFLAIPPQAGYFCFAYPLHSAECEEMLKQINYTGTDFSRAQDANIRLLLYGGFLYFDSEKEFISASTLTTNGNGLSFNGPFNFSKSASKRLQVENRWNDVTIDALVPKELLGGNPGQNEEIAKMQFAWVFPAETDSPDHNIHGGFAYRVSLKKARSGDLEAPDHEEKWENDRAIIFTLAMLDESVIL